MLMNGKMFLNRWVNFPKKLMGLIYKLWVNYLKMAESESLRNAAVQLAKSLKNQLQYAEKRAQDAEKQLEEAKAEIERLSAAYKVLFRQMAFKENTNSPS